MTNIDIILAIFCFYTYYKSENLIYIFLNAFVILYLINVIVVFKFLDIPFSPSQSKFGSFELITSSLLAFVMISWFSFGKIKMKIDKLYIKNRSTALDYLKGSIIIIYSIYLFYSKGFRLGGEFLDYAGQRDIYEDYIALVFLIFFISSRASKFLVLSFLTISASYFFAGERMRMFIYIGSVCIYFYSNRLVIIKIGLIFAYLFAEIISLLRSTSDFGLNESGSFVSHFGSVTVSSLYLDNFTSILSTAEKVQYFFGIILGNFLPSSLLPLGFNIRGDLSAAFTIPGGGWFPSYLLLTSNWFVYICFSVILCLFIRRLLNINSLKSQYMLFILLITTPRWFMYSPYLIFRFVLYASLTLYIIKIIKYEPK